MKADLGRDGVPTGSTTSLLLSRSKITILAKDIPCLCVGMATTILGSATEWLHGDDMPSVS